MLELYWFLGEQIIEKQKTANWGDGFLKQISHDLHEAFPSVKGFSYRNLKYMRQWVQFWSSDAEIGQQPVAQLESVAKTVIGQQVAAQITGNQPSTRGIANAAQLVSQIPWGHNLVLLHKFSNTADALFYVQKAIENSWSRSVLTHQIESARGQGRVCSNRQPYLIPSG